MAIRTAGEKKFAALQPRLKQLTQSEDPFVADYAKAAIAALADLPNQRSHEPSNDDVWLLPADCRAVLHITASAGAPPDTANIELLIDPMLRLSAEAQQQRAHVAYAELLAVAEQVGNVRLDGVTVGISGDIGPNAGQVVIALHALYDHQAMTRYLATLPSLKSDVREGVAVASIGDTGLLLLPDDHRLIAVISPKLSADFAASYLQTLKQATQPLKQVPSLVKLLDRVDKSGPIWGCCRDHAGLSPCAGFRKSRFRDARQPHRSCQCHPGGRLRLQCNRDERRRCGQDAGTDQQGPGRCKRPGSFQRCTAENAAGGKNVR